jgi:phosphoesterase RecJ-like protein
MKYLTPAKIPHLNQLLREAKQIVITSHRSPDGDSMGCSLGLYHYLKKQNFPVVVCHPDIHRHFSLDAWYQ